MRDPQQLCLDFEGKGQEETTAEFDARVQANLSLSRVWTHCWGLENGHARFYNTVPPRTQEFLDARDHLLENPDAFGHQYLSTILKIIRERTAELVVNISTLRRPFEEEEIRAGVHVTCLQSNRS